MYQRIICAQISESGTGRFYLHFKDATAIGEVTPETNISFRHLDGKIIINNSGQESGIISLVNLSGQIFERLELDGRSTQELDINCTSGIYIISIQSEKALISKKVFIN